MNQLLQSSCKINMWFQVLSWPASFTDRQEVRNTCLPIQPFPAKTSTRIKNQEAGEVWVQCDQLTKVFVSILG